MGRGQVRFELLCSRGVGELLLCGAGYGPVPGEQVVQLGLGYTGDACEDVGEPDLRIDVAHFGGDDECVHESGALAAAI
jgi:hypothetical protein